MLSLRKAKYSVVWCPVVYVGLDLLMWFYEVFLSGEFET